MTDIFTIGHSRHDLATFLALLRGHAIAVLADVRRKPWSRRHPQFNRERLAGSLAEAGIAYRHDEALGGFRDAAAQSAGNAAWREPFLHAYADYALTPAFAAAFGSVCAVARTKPLAIMCAEADWHDCHRQIIADYLLANGFAVRHIGPDGTIDAGRMNPAARVESPAAIRYPGPPTQGSFAF
jgi:uncharacterized protein (DUF488 family)